MAGTTEHAVRELLREVRWPGYDTDIVAAGFVGAVVVQGGDVTVEFQPRTARGDKVLAMEAEIRRVVGAAPGVDGVHVRRTLPVLDMVLRDAGTMTPLEAEVREDGGVPDRATPDRATPPLDTTYTGDLPVYQWEIDPAKSDVGSDEACLFLGDWEYRMWWQVHPRGLVYVSVQAIEDDTIDHGSVARRHPVGRAVAVNLVYDEMRRAIVAIYGTAHDFRPFVEAFRLGYGWTADPARTVHESESR